MDYENRFENRIENIFHPESGRSSVQFLPPDIHSSTPVPPNYINNLRFEYDVLLYALMEGNHMPFNRSLPLPLDECIEGPSDPTASSCGLEYRAWPANGENPQLNPALFTPNQENLLLNNQFNQTYYQPSKQLTKQSVESIYNDIPMVRAEQDSDTRQVKLDIPHNSPKEPLVGESTLQSLIATSAPEFPRSSPEIDLQAQEELTALQKHYYTFLLGIQNGANVQDANMTDSNPEVDRPEAQIKTEVNVEEPVQPLESSKALESVKNLESANLEQPSSVKAEKKETKKKNKKAGINIKVEQQSGIMLDSLISDNEEQYPALPVECLSPLERWKLHCQRHKTPKIKKGPVPCPHCNKSYPNMDECTKHLDQEGFKQKNICPDESCKYSIFGFRVRSHLRRHICNEHLKRYNQKRLRSTQGRKKDLPGVKVFLSHVYVCKHKDCSRAFYRSDSLTRHGRLTHEAKGQSKASETLECEEGM